MNLADAQARSGKSDRRLLVVRLACLAFLVCAAVFGGARLERAAAEPPGPDFATRAGPSAASGAQAKAGTSQLRQTAHAVAAHELEAADPEDTSEDASLVSAVRLADRAGPQASYDGKVVFVLGEASARQLLLSPTVARGPP